MGPVFTKRDIVIGIALSPVYLLICGPIVGVKWVARKSWDIITGKKPPQPYKRPPLLPRRPLTPPLQEDSGHGQDQGKREGKQKHKEKRNTKDQDAPIPRPQFYTQSQSIFFKLPPEVRAMIYRKILSFPIPLRIQTNLGRSGLYTDRKDRRQNRDLSWTVLGLLACCRRVYSESIHLLYETNVLNFLATEVFTSILKLPMYIVPSRLRTFRSLRLVIFLHPGGLDRSEVIWRQVCDVLKTMTGLQSLLVQFWCQEGVVDLVPYLEAMAGIRATEFKVYMNRRLSIRGGPNPEVFPHGTPFDLLRESSEGNWKPWVWWRSAVS